MGTDHPNGKWSDRHKKPASSRSSGGEYGLPQVDDDPEHSLNEEKSKSNDVNITVDTDVKEAMSIGILLVFFAELFTSIF